MTPNTTLLIVDDEPGVRSLIVGWLHTRSFTVTEAGTAGEALDQMAEHRRVRRRSPRSERVVARRTDEAAISRYRSHHHDRIRHHRAAAESRGRRDRIPAETIYGATAHADAQLGVGVAAAERLSRAGTDCVGFEPAVQTASIEAEHPGGFGLVAAGARQHGDDVIAFDV